MGPNLFLGKAILAVFCEMSHYGILEACFSAYIYVPFLFLSTLCNTMGLIVKFVKGKSICARFFCLLQLPLESVICKSGVSLFL